MHHSTHSQRKIREAEEANDVKLITDFIRHQDCHEKFTLTASGCKIAQLDCWDDLANSDARKSMLVSAIKRGDANQVRMLLVISESAASARHSFDINSHDCFGEAGRTLMHEAAEAGHSAVIDALVEAGAKVDILDDNTCLQPLHLAVVNGHHEAAKTLRRAGATAREVSDVCRSAVESAIRRAALSGRADLVRTIATAHGTVDDESLPLAAEQGHQSVVVALLECGARVNQSDIEGFTALHHAAKRGDSKMMRLLFAFGASPCVHANGDGNLQCPLHVAANGRVVDMLLAHGASVDQRAWMGHTPLHTAINDGRTDAAMALVEAGSDQTIANPTRLEQVKEDRARDKKKSQGKGRWFTKSCVRTAGKEAQGERPVERQGRGLHAILGFPRFHA